MGPIFVAPGDLIEGRVAALPFFIQLTISDVIHDLIISGL